MVLPPGGARRSFVYIVIELLASLIIALIDIVRLFLFFFQPEVNQFSADRPAAASVDGSLDAPDDDVRTTE